jgi:hypothetical protein
MAVELKDKLIELIEWACEQEQAFYAGLSEEERAVQGRPDCWSPKDVMAHVGGWKIRLADNLAAARSGEPPERYDDYEAVNAAGFEECRDLPWSEVLETAAVGGRRLVEEVQVRDEAELRGTETLPWQGDRPLWRLIVGNGFIHPLTIHLGPMYLELGKRGLAADLAGEVARRLSELDARSEWQGLVQYNLACHHALAGEVGPAIERLREALELAPDMTDWARQDPDLDLIREEEGYRELCGD